MQLNNNNCSVDSKSGAVIIHASPELQETQKLRAEVNELRSELKEIRQLLEQALQNK